MGQQESRDQEVRIQQSQRRAQGVQQQQMQGFQQPRNYDEYNRMYRQFSQHQRRQAPQQNRQQDNYNQWAQLQQKQRENQKQEEDTDLKTFNLKSYIHSDTIKTNIKGKVLQLSFKVDTKVNCNVRISACVTEEKNENNVPVMFYTPNREDYVQNVNLPPGMKQEINFGDIDFQLQALEKYELTKNDLKYTPLIISINYTEKQQNFAFISYCIFVKDSEKKITGARSIKQIVLINGLPFQIKSIFGLTQPDQINGEAQDIKGEANDDNKECTICLSAESDTIIMPCGHMCICMDCGKSIKASKHPDCPVCRAKIDSLVPMKR